MKVLKIIHTLGHGGAENTFRWLAWGLRQQGVEVVAAIPRAGGPNDENWIGPALEELEVPYLTFDSSGSPGRLFRQIDLLVNEVRPDIVHSHLLDSNFYSGLVCRRRSLPHVCTEHGDVSFRQTAVSRIKYGLISCCSRYIICVSDAVKEKAARVIPFRNKLKTVYNGIHFVEKVPSTFRLEFSLPESALLIGNVGNLYPVKGQTHLVRAFSELLKYRPNAYLVLVGRGSEERRLREQVRELNLPGDRVLFTGFRDDVENIMNALDLYIQPSLSEGHPVAVLEAMSLGVPVIASAVGGVPELLGENRYGTLAIAGAWESLHGCMMAYLDDPEGFRDRARASRAFVRENFSVEKMAQNYIDIYRRAIA